MIARIIAAAADARRVQTSLGAVLILTARRNNTVAWQRTMSKGGGKMAIGYVPGDLWLPY